MSRVEDNGKSTSEMTVERGKERVVHLTWWEKRENGISYICFYCYEITKFFQ